MKHIAITGSTSGIGLELKKQLIELGYKVDNFSRSNGFDFTKNESIEKITSEIKKNKYDTLFLNTGVMAKNNIGEIKNNDIDWMMKVNTISNLKIINNLFNEISSGKLKVIVTLSTAAYTNGVHESIYNSSKKALNEFIISANTELKVMKSNATIFTFIPHYIRGTGMTNGITNEKELSEIITSLIKAIEEGGDTYVPKYKEVYKKVFKLYKNDPIKQGLQSVLYRKGRDEK